MIYVHDSIAHPQTLASQLASVVRGHPWHCVAEPVGNEVLVTVTDRQHTHKLWKRLGSPEEIVPALRQWIVTGA